MANANDTQLLQSTIVLLATAFRDTIRRQLSDFIDGPYSEIASEDAAKRTSFAPITNLSCEHHFGDLDSSQRRLPNASLHHHSTVQMLKRNRSNIVDWLEKLPDTERASVFMNARLNGPLLRVPHRQQDSDVRKAIFDEAQQTAQPSHKATAKGNKKEKPNKNAQRQATLRQQMEDGTQSLQRAEDGDWVAVAYQEGFYTGTHFVIILSYYVPSTNAMLQCVSPAMYKIKSTISCFIVNSGSSRMLEIGIWMTFKTF